MKPRKNREIVVEFERVQVVRRRARAHVLLCRECASERDFIGLIDASTLFSTPSETLLEFIRINRIHFLSGAEGEILICLTTLLAALRKHSPNSRVKLLND